MNKTSSFMDKQKVFIEKIERLKSIGIALSSEQDIDRLLEMILLGAKELTNADGGTLYILQDDHLHFSLLHTTSLSLHMGGTSGQPVNFSPIALFEDNDQPNLRLIVTRAAIEGCTINIPDAYGSDDYDFSGTHEFDRRIGYRSTALLAVPMLDHEGQVIGVLQLINPIDSKTGDIRPFGDHDESLVSSLASQAAIALTRKKLIDGLEDLLRSLVKLIAEAIDEKSPHTAGHCRRVPPITMSLAYAVNDDKGPVFGDVSFDRKKLEELELAAWLHDCGKITTPEYIVDKRTRLETIFDRIELIDARIEILRRDAEIDRLRGLLGEKPVRDVVLPDNDTLEEIRDFLRHCNTTGFIDDTMRGRIDEVSKLSYLMKDEKEPRPLLTNDEKSNLSITRGTLTSEERQIINNHIQATTRMLSSLPFPKKISRVPEIAGGHHERMDGKGYPQNIPAGELSLQARILAIADVFEALTASDRVYRKPNTLSESLRIMAFMCNEGHFDKDLLKLFINTEAYRDYVSETLKPEQIDEVDKGSILAILD